MFLISNSIRNIFRNRRRYIIFFLILLAVSIVSMTSFLTGNACRDYIAREKNNSQKYVQILNYTLRGDEELNEHGLPTDFWPVYTKKEAEMYGDSDYVKDTVIILKEHVGFDNLSQINPIDPDRTGQYHYNRSFLIAAYNKYDFEEFPDYKMNYVKLVDGKMYGTETGECVISTELAEKNNISIGDTIHITKEERFKDYTNLKVVGLYDMKNYYTINSTINNDLRSTIFTNIATIISLLTQRPADDFENSETGFTVNEDSFLFGDAVVWELYNADDLPAFREEVYSKGLDTRFHIGNNKDIYDSSSAPVQSFSFIFNIAIVITIFLGAIVIVFISTLLIKARKYETGILYSLGVTKKYIFAGFLVELLAFILSVMLIGFLISIVASIFILQNYLPNFTDVTISVDFQLIVQFIVITFILIFIPILSMFIQIMKSSPVRLLQSKN